ncbi:efflux RND transporter periplasmic adaptor subunit [Sinomicrobium weinanense]|uniref:Efflux RND transporter periplasmic adaptor subunit n=1 Tax=Sinomicrobium weinanense TaxID=2842200 RepID=A0A926JSE0_9FLAO|nr:efflux RND transporter periplasmic adaptor subunit [Sinomicrobium weinanense]MBC9796640.1 efflux RND transporter periplasmic adaptor subunit [Sinomicrobium weinanense]MBU3124889.1 efflux RND transporter periplasmic adaptor subunit [Sinomicrobium weinanense]
MKILKYIGIAVLIIAALFAAAYFIKSNSKSPITYESESPFITSIEEKSVATGKVIPEDEVAIKPQISGIIGEILVEEGDKLQAGDLIAKIKVVPNEQTLNTARGRVSNANIALNNAKIEYDRNKVLFEKGVISSQEFNNIELTYNQAKQELANAQSDLQIIRKGSAGGSTSANTDVKATIAGTVLEIPVKIGDQVIESNNFNDGTTIASIADLSKMIFEGMVDEAEVGKLEVGSPLKISFGAIPDKEFEGKLKFVAPKWNEEEETSSGVVQFKIEADVFIEDNHFIRAGYSANASLTLEKKDSVLAIKEALLQFDRETEQPYVEVEVGDQEFERKDVETGISDGINIEIISGLSESDKVKVWNKTEPEKKETASN